MPVEVAEQVLGALDVCSSLHLGSAIWTDEVALLPCASSIEMTRISFVQPFFTTRIYTVEGVFEGFISYIFRRH